MKIKKEQINIKITKKTRDMEGDSGKNKCRRRKKKEEEEGRRK